MMPIRPTTTGAGAGPGPGGDFGFGGRGGRNLGRGANAGGRSNVDVGSNPPPGEAAGAGRPPAVPPPPPPPPLPPCHELLSKLLIRRRLFSSTFLLIAVTLSVLPPLAATVYIVLSFLSNQHERISLILGTGLTWYVRDGIARYAPTYEKRTRALENLKIRLPFWSLVTCAMLCRYVWDPALRWWMNDNNGGTSPSRSKSTGGWGWELWIHSMYAGLHLGIMSSFWCFAVYVRFVGPVAIVRCSNAPLADNPYQTAMSSAWMRFRRHFSSVDAFLDFLVDMSTGDATPATSATPIPAPRRVGSVVTRTGGQQQQQQQQQQRPNNRPIITNSNIAEFQAMATRERKAKQLAEKQKQRSDWLTSTASAILPGLKGFYKRPTFVKSTIQVVLNVGGGGFFGTSLCYAVASIATLVGLPSSSLLFGTSTSSPPHGVARFRFCAVLLSGALAGLFVSFRLLSSDRGRSSNGGVTGGSRGGGSSSSSSLLQTELDIRSCPDLGLAMEEGPNDNVIPTVLRLVRKEVRDTVRESIAPFVVFAVVGLPIATYFMDGGGAGQGDDDDPSTAVVLSTFVRCGLALARYLSALLPMFMAYILAVGGMTVADVLSRIFLCQPVRLESISRAGRIDFASYYPSSSPDDGSVVCSPSRLVLETVLRSPSLIESANAPLGTAVGKEGTPPPLLSGRVDFEGAEVRRVDAIGTELAEQYLNLTTSSKGNTLSIDLGRALILESLGGGGSHGPSSIGAAYDPIFGLPRHKAAISRRVSSRHATPVLRALAAYAGSLGEMMHRKTTTGTGEKKGVVGIPTTTSISLSPAAISQGEWAVIAAARMIVAGIQANGRHSEVSVLVPAVIQSVYRLRAGCVRFAQSITGGGGGRAGDDSAALSEQQVQQRVVVRTSELMRGATERRKAYVRMEIEQLGIDLLVTRPDAIGLVIACDEAAMMAFDAISVLDRQAKLRLTAESNGWIQKLVHVG